MIQRVLLLAGFFYLAVYQSVNLQFEWLVLVAVLLGLKQYWLEVFILGLIMDLVYVRNLGMTSFFYLVIGMISFFVKYRLLIIKHRPIKLKE